VPPSAPQHVTRLWSSAQALRTRVGQAVLREFDIDYPLAGNRAAHEQALATARAALDPEAFSVAWTAGQALTWEQAVAEALAIPVASPA
jgi:hypothetical protein